MGLNFEEIGACLSWLAAGELARRLNAGAAPTYCKNCRLEIISLLESYTNNNRLRNFEFTTHQRQCHPVLYRLHKRGQKSIEN